ncbi:golgin subfamily A member 6-like protein 22 [Polistes fuscatus]|uniref:golgin subfamily A member 6-like protein 22 n=1 Tax=Polistes fuscatus TaxID=30207 RepID=UPI001CA8BC8A|nr:golgin subfamily A member 6-like protein 22 [Polistes fuscatus]
MVHLEELDDLVNQMMKVPIFSHSEKQRLLEDDNNTGFLDPNLIMDTRHKITRETLNNPDANCSALAEAKRLLKEKEIKEMCLKKERVFLEMELRRFEKELHKSRPKFQRQYECRKKNLANSNDQDFWSISNKIEMDIKTVNKSKVQTFGTKSKQTSVEELSPIFENTNTDDIDENDENDVNESVGNIKVTIKNKINFNSVEKRLNLMKKYFEFLKEYSTKERRFREIKIKLQESMASKRLKRYFNFWKTYTEDKKNTAKIKKELQDVSHERKIEIFISEITEKKKKLGNHFKSKIKNNVSFKIIQENEDKKKLTRQKNNYPFQSFVENRLNTQKIIIEKQKSKLAEQNRIIEELKLKQIQQELVTMDKETMNVAKETLMNCGQKTRRTLILLMKQAGYRNKCTTTSQQTSNPPKFIMRVEARAEARRERLRKAEETRQKKLEEQKLKEEATKREEEEKRKKLQQESMREARKLREEQKKCRMEELEKFKKLNLMANQFYCKYLFRHYVIEPFKKLIKIRNDNIQRANDHYKKFLLLQTLTAWRRETKEQYQIKLELAISLHNRNLLWYTFKDWTDMVKEENIKHQVAKDFYDMKLQEKCFRALRSIVAIIKLEYLKYVKIAEEHYNDKLVNKYFNKWRDYPTIAEIVKESEKQRNKWREIVQKLVPDFDPKERGVVLED